MNAPHRIEHRRLSALNGYNLAAGLVTWIVMGGCVYLIVSGAL